MMILMHGRFQCGGRSDHLATGAFSLVELLVAMAIIGVMSALVITSITNVSRDSKLVTARQQQVVLQEALNAWLAAAASGTNSLANARTAYQGAGTASAKLALLRNYLQSGTYDEFVAHSSSSQIKTDAMNGAGAYLQFSAWNTTNYPSVEMIR
jgi:prepilin-type N-terminal cleavage/methylation domain-containing protein